MKLFCRTIAAVTAITLLVACLMGCSVKNADAQSSIVSSTRYIGQARGFLVTGEDFPGAAASVEAQQSSLDKMVDFAVENRLNTIYFEVRPGGAALYKSKYFPYHAVMAIQANEKQPFDVLDYLCQKAQGSKVQVVAVADAFYLPESLPGNTKNPYEGLSVSGDRLDPRDIKLHKLLADSSAELVKSYGLAGVMLTGLDVSYIQGPEAAAGVEGMVRTVAAAMKKANKSAALAVSFDAGNQHNAMSPALVQKLSAEGIIQMVVPVLDAAVEDEGPTGYLSQLEQWTSIPLSATELYTCNRYAPGDPLRLQDQLLANAIQGGVAGVVLAPFSFLQGNDPAQNQLLVSLLAAGGSLPAPLRLDISPKLSVSYPADGATVYDKSIYVMGTSDPAQPLLMGGEEVTRLGDKGTFGVEIALDVGANAVTFAQGNATATVKINRAAAPTTPAPISKITEASLFPTSTFGADSNETIEISCTGPAGASITATLGGQTVVLAQAATAASGTPVTFKGSVTLSPSAYPDDRVTDAGVVTYVVSFNGGHEVQRSPAQVYVAGKNVPLVVEVKQGQYVASVLTDLKSDDNFTQSLTTGARAAVAGKTRITRSGGSMAVYRLASGGYLLGDKVSIVTDAARCTKPELTQITKTQGDDWEQYAFPGGQPAVLTDLTENTLTLRFLNATLTADPSDLAGGLVQAVDKKDTEDGFALALTFAPGTLWGYDLFYQEESTCLYLRRSPTRSATPGKPLEGITVMLDPGHGGPDPGAMGVAGTNGPTEAILNMAVSSVAKFRLEQLGARVLMTRVDESQRVSLDARNFMARQERPHLFLAIHHNSTALTKDLSQVRRMEAYYWESIAQPFANSLMQQMEAMLKRTTTPPENAYYYVTRLTFAPAVLFEMGFVVNPLEYEQSCNPASLCRGAGGIAAAVLETIPSSS